MALQRGVSMVSPLGGARLSVWGLLLLGLAQSASALEVEGELRWLRRVELGLPLSGVVAEVSVQPGQRVAEGELLLKLDARLQQAQLRRAEARNAREQLAMEEAERELERAEELYARTLLSDHDLQVARLAHAEAKAARQDASSALSEARVQLDYTRLKAPFDALVLERRVEPGESVNSELGSQPLLVLADRREMVARVLLNAEQMRGLTGQVKAGVVVEGQRLSGTLQSLGYEPTAEGGYPVDVRFSLGETPLPRVGQRVRVELP